MADIARETGLTLGTVSRALSTEGKYPIAKETRKRVAEAAFRLGFKPNLIGKALAEGSASLVMVVSPDPFGPYYVEVSRHLSAEATRHGFTLVTGGTSPDFGEMGIPNNDWLYGVDGMIVCDYLPHQEAYISEALRLKIPIVGLGVRHPFPTDFVQIDLYTAAKQLFQYLLNSGRKVPAMICGRDTGLDDPREKAYFEFCTELGVQPRFLISRNHTRAAGRETVTDSLRDGEKFDLLFCENDILAVGALRGLGDLGIKVPEEVLLAGCDGMEDASYQATPITTLVQPFEQMCGLAWNFLAARMGGQIDDPRVAQVAATLEIRASTYF